MIWAPWRAASRTSCSAQAMFAWRSQEQAIWVAATVTIRLMTLSSQKGGRSLTRSSPLDNGARGLFGASDGMQVPVVLEVGDRVLELLQFALLAGDEDVDVLGADVLRQDLAVVEQAKGVAEVVGQVRLELFVGVAFHRRRRLDLRGQAVMDAGQYRREQQVGVGVGAGHPVFDAHGVRRIGRHAQRHRTVVETPAGGVRHVELRAEAAVRVDVGTEE